jgi:flagellar operon protein
MNTPQVNPNPQTKPAQKTGSSAFDDLFRKNLEQAAQQPITFSKHATARAEERGISVDDTLLGQLSNSVSKAQEKGATNILAFDATRAFIINVPHGRVITTMSQEEMRENIFTNIDGAVIL